MKGCMYLQRHFAPLGHILITLLRERHGIDSWCGYVLDRANLAFLENQKEIPYSALLLEDDVVAQYKNEVLDMEYLAALEREYGIPNLWPHLICDRVIRYNLYRRAYPSDVSLYSHEEMMRMVQTTARAIINFFDREKPDFIFFSVVGNLSSMLLYHIAKKKGIQTLLLDGARIGIKYFLSERYDRSTFLEETVARLRKSLRPGDPRFREAERFLAEFRRAPRYFLEASGGAGAVLEGFKRSRLAHFSFLSPRKFWRSLRWTLFAFSEYARKSRREDYIVMHPWHELLDKVKRKARILRGYGALYDEPVAGEDFAYFALHTEPEAYPMILAPFYTDQLWLAKQIARSLPLSCKLYVKDHPVMTGLRLRSYYRELKKLPNVRLLHPKVSGLRLIRESKLTLTLTGTTGFEAALLKKPVILFGPMYYSRLLGVKVCSDINQLPYLVKTQLEEFRSDETELVTLIAALMEESIDLELVQMWDLGEGEREARRKWLIPLSDLIAKKLGVT
ncbi:MAG: hypothetical protein AAB699_00910 [Patescibacteria group bacterium]